MVFWKTGSMRSFVVYDPVKAKISEYPRYLTPARKTSIKKNNRENKRPKAVRERYDRKSKGCMM